MKYGIREICDVVLKAKAAMKVGEKVFYKDEPVIYFDTLKTTSLEGASTSVYATGGRGNTRLIAWEGERTVTFTMEDALISPVGLMILAGAGLVEATSSKQLYVHTTEQTDEVYVTKDGNDKITKVDIYLKNKPYTPTTGAIAQWDEPRALNDYIYVMLLKDGEIITEPYIPDEITAIATGDATEGRPSNLYKISISAAYDGTNFGSDNYNRKNNFDGWGLGPKENVVLVDYYVEKSSGVYEVQITPETFGGNFYLEASTLFRTQSGVDMPAEFIIPNCKIQSNFNFSMASSGDPSTFTFTMDAFPDYTRWDKTKKVLAAIQVINLGSDLLELERLSTGHGDTFSGVTPYTTALKTIDSDRYPDENRNQKDIIEG